MYRKWVKISLVLIYLVIIAGAVVRMTGSGMGCPDWPKCFGHWIPPTERNELDWRPNQEFHKGQVIIVDETLQVAITDFISEKEFQKKNWEQYTKHDYAIFNALHTWVEYINRLFGALAGLAIFIMAIVSFKNWKDKKSLVIVSWLSVFLMGFQGWLGATVVYSVLSPVKITIHMVVALVIVGVLLYLLKVSKESTKKTYVDAALFKRLLVFSLLLTLIQVVLGAQVREFVDEQVKMVGYENPSLWLENPTFVFYFHRSFSILVVVVNLLLWYLNKKNNYGFQKIKYILALILAEVFIGLGMYYFDFPFLSQPLHLVLATILFAVQFYIVLEAFQQKNQSKVRNFAT